MKITIDKKNTMVAYVATCRQFAAELRRDRQIIDDMQTLVAGIERANGRILYGGDTEIAEIELFSCMEEKVHFCVMAERRDCWIHDGDYIRDSTVTLRVFGAATWDGQTWMWEFDDQDQWTGVPTVFQARIYAELLD